MAVFYVLGGLFLLRVVLLGIGAALIVRPAPRCPACFAENIAICNWWLKRLAPWLEVRWCPHCQWQGLARKSPGGGTQHRAHPPIDSAEGLGLRDDF